MQTVNEEQNDFCSAYILKKFGEQYQFLTAHEGANYIKNMDSVDFKRMMTAYRASKKRSIDKEYGNTSVNITISALAHSILKSHAQRHNVTLSHFIECFMSDIQTDVVELCDTVTKNVSPIELGKVDDEIKYLLSFPSESKILDLIKYIKHRNLESKYSEEIERLEKLIYAVEVCDTVTIEQPKQPEPPKPVIHINDKKFERRCMAKTSKGGRCKQTEHLDCDGETVLCNFHMGILRRSHANSFKLFDGRLI